VRRRGLPRRHPGPPSRASLFVWGSNWKDPYDSKCPKPGRSLDGQARSRSGCSLGGHVLSQWNFPPMGAWGGGLAKRWGGGLCGRGTILSSVFEKRLKQRGPQRCRRGPVKVSLSLSEAGGAPLMNTRERDHVPDLVVPVVNLVVETPKPLRKSGLKPYGFFPSVTLSLTGPQLPRFPLAIHSAPGRRKRSAGLHW